MQCPNCQATVSEGSAFCNKCGYDLRPRVVSPPPVYARPAKDPNVALLIEMVGTFFGFMGLGWLYGGYTARGIVSLLVWLVVVVAAGVFSVLSGGIFACFWLPVQVIAAIISGLLVKQAVERDNLRL